MRMPGHGPRVKRTTYPEHHQKAIGSMLLVLDWRYAPTSAEVVDAAHELALMMTEEESDE